jgi:hypothetical protein
MAVEQIRGCGYRKINALYICGEYIRVPCDRLPLPLTTCPVCGQGIKVSRGFTQVNPYRLWGIHEGCRDTIRPCFVCDPKDEPAYIMGVGAKYYSPESFLEEAQRVGISKRIPFVPKGLVLGKTVIYLAHPKAVEVKESAILQHAMNILEASSTNQPHLLEVERKEKALGIFCAFIPRRVEQLVWEHELTDEKRKELERRGITPIPVPDGDIDHA